MSIYVNEISIVVRSAVTYNLLLMILNPSMRFQVLELLSVM